MKESSGRKARSRSIIRRPHYGMALGVLTLLASRALARSLPDLFGGCALRDNLRTEDTTTSLLWIECGERENRPNLSYSSSSFREVSWKRC